MTTFHSQFGDSLINPADDRSTVSPSDALSGKDVVMLYFSAHWCPPCRQFTPKLIDLYNKLKKDETKNMELVFCSLDNDEDQYKEYTSDMPWLCMPFEAPESKKLAGKYNAQGIPHLVVVNGTDGTVITYKGTEEVRGDANGTNFPWKPKTMSEIMPEKIIGTKESGGEMVDVSTLKDKYLMLYFSAHWCPPCQAFTPVLSKAYTQMKKEINDDFELIFVSSDRDERTFKEYFDTMTFCALPYEHRDIKAQLSNKFDVSGIPSLVIMGPEDETTGERPLINKSIRGYIDSGDFSEFPFHKKNHGALDNAEDINGTKSLIIFHENGDDDEHKEIKDLVKNVGEQLKEKEPKMEFLHSVEAKGLGPRVKSVVGMAEMSEDAKMIILDVPDNGGYYISDLEVTLENVLKFIETPGERKQLE